MHAPGFVIAAPQTGSGKTLVTLGLIRAFSRRGLRVASFKVGPDYIDPAFHLAAGARACPNLDSWAMRLSTLTHLADRASLNADLLIGEGVMGLFDGAPDNTGSTADVASLLGLPVVLVLDAKGLGQSIAPLAEGFVNHRNDVDVPGIILNRTSGSRHAQMLAHSLDAALPGRRLGALPNAQALAVPSRHLGLVQAHERDVATLADRAADVVEAHVDLARLKSYATPLALAAFGDGGIPVPPPGQRIAVAEDAAFSFTYRATLDGWRRAGASIHPFAPLADQAPDADADAVFLPGGYPELHAGTLAAAGSFLDGLRAAASRGSLIYGECGGFMVLGRALIDHDGAAHAMAGLLPTVTSFAEPRLHLGYRSLQLRSASFLGQPGTTYRGHEFHYARLIEPATAAAPFAVADALGRSLGPAGAEVGTVLGSFMHLIDRTREPRVRPVVN